MKILTKHQLAQLLKNGREAAKSDDFDPYPVVKLFTPDADCTWLLAWLEPGDTDLAYGLCDLGVGCPELGTVRLSELVATRGKLGLPIERDLTWTATNPLHDYARLSLTRRLLVDTL